MKVTMMDNPGKEDDLIRRGMAINTVTEKEGWYPASLWYVPPAEAWIEADDMEPICPCITIDANRNIHLTTEKFEVNQGRRDANGNSYDNQHFYVDGALTHGIERKEMFKSVLIYENRITHWMPLPEPPKEDTK